MVMLVVLQMEMVVGLVLLWLVVREMALVLLVAVLLVLTVAHNMAGLVVVVLVLLVKMVQILKLEMVGLGLHHPSLVRL
jgi:hypothetical protein